jgi:hypothetical protein
MFILIAMNEWFTQLLCLSCTNVNCSGGNNLLVWFHALALAHAQRRTLLAPPWCSVPANETWDLDRLAAGACSRSSLAERRNPSCRTYCRPSCVAKVVHNAFLRTFFSS